jgi:hypothetical protein
VNTSKPTTLQDPWDDLDNVEYDDSNDDKDAMSSRVGIYTL